MTSPKETGVSRAVVRQPAEEQLPRRAPPLPEPERIRRRKGGLPRGAKVALASVAALLALETAGAAVQEQVNHQEVSATTIPGDLAWPWNLGVSTGVSTVEDIQRFFNKSPQEITVPPDTFSKKADNGSITTDNTIVLFPEEIQQEFPEQIVEDQANNTATILFPFQAPKGEKIEFNQVKFRQIELTAQGPKEVSNPSLISRSELTLPKGTLIVSPIDGRIALTTDKNDKNKVTRAALYFYDPARDTSYIITIGFRYYPASYYFNPEPSMAPNLDLRLTTDRESWPQIKRGTPIMTTAQDQEPVIVSITTYPGKDLDATRTPEKTSHYISPQFATVVGDGGVEKLIAMALAD